MKKKIISIVGARPQFIKLAPIFRIFKKYNELKHIVLHTGQHYDFLMSDLFFKTFGLPRPDVNLSIGSGSHHSQTGEMVKRIGNQLELVKPDLVIIYGDTNTTLSGAIAAVKLSIPVAHIESGLRSYIRYMPEEINRTVADRLSEILFVPSDNAIYNLKKEGINNLILDFDGFKKSPPPYVVKSGDLMYDILRVVLQDVRKSEASIIKKYGLEKGRYILATVHRAENTDNIKNLINIIDGLSEISRVIDVILPLHPRTSKILKENKLEKRLNGIQVIKPLSYNEMLILEKNSRIIFTDSGGVQKEAFWLKIPCVTMRDRTEWVETIRAGYNILTGADRVKIIKAFEKFQQGIKTDNNLLDVYGDGNAAKKIVKFIRNYLRCR